MFTIRLVVVSDELPLEDGVRMEGAIMRDEILFMDETEATAIHRFEASMIGFHCGIDAAERIGAIVEDKSFKGGPLV